MLLHRAISIVLVYLVLRYYSTDNLKLVEWYQIGINQSQFYRPRVVFRLSFVIHVA